MTEGLTVLGSTVRHAIDHVEVFPAPADVTLVTFTNDELASMCPVTEQPDLSTVVIEYVPGGWCVESKSLKLYLWGFRDRAHRGELIVGEPHARDVLWCREHFDVFDGMANGATQDGQFHGTRLLSTQSNDPGGM